MIEYEWDQNRSTIARRTVVRPGSIFVAKTISPLNHSGMVIFSLVVVKEIDIT